MSPTSSAQASGGPSKPSHSRHTSSVAVPNQEPRAAKASSPRPSPIIEARPDVHYTCFIRLPFPRGDFQDPLPVNWDAIKDKTLWKLISQASSSKVCLPMYSHRWASVMSLLTVCHRNSNGRKSPPASTLACLSCCNRQHGSTKGTSKA